MRSRSFKHNTNYYHNIKISRKYNSEPSKQTMDYELFGMTTGGICGFVLGFFPFYSDDDTFVDINSHFLTRVSVAMIIVPVFTFTGGMLGALLRGFILVPITASIFIAYGDKLEQKAIQVNKKLKPKS